MTKLLALNPAHCRFLSSRLGLGDQVGDLCRVHGGFHHKMWRLETRRGTYAIKQLATDADLGDPATVNHYNATEQVAETFAGLGLPAISALKSHSGFLQLVEETAYLVYPWTDAVALHKMEIREAHVVAIARILARMHLADISVPRLADVPFDFHPEEKIVALVRRAGECHARHAQVLDQHLPAFLQIADRQGEAIRALAPKAVISHGDIDHRNVLWNNGGDPVIIDWESARRVHPTYELVLEALDWSGITSTFQPGLFRQTVSAYTQAGGVIDGDSLRAAFDCVLGDWLNWLMYNVGRSVDLQDAELRSLGADQVDLALATILRLQRLLPNLLLAVEA